MALAIIKLVAKDIANIKDDGMMILAKDFHAPLANREVQHQSSQQPLMNFRPGSIRPAQYQSHRSLQIQRSIFYELDYIKLQPLHNLLSARSFPREQVLEPLPSLHTIEDLLQRSKMTADYLPDRAEALSRKIAVA